MNTELRQKLLDLAITWNHDDANESSRATGHANRPDSLAVIPALNDSGRDLQVQLSREPFTLISTRNTNPGIHIVPRTRDQYGLFEALDFLFRFKDERTIETLDTESLQGSQTEGYKEGDFYIELQSKSTMSDSQQVRPLIANIVIKSDGSVCCNTEDGRELTIPSKNLYRLLNQLLNQLEVMRRGSQQEVDLSRELYPLSQNTTGRVFDLMVGIGLFPYNSDLQRNLQYNHSYPYIFEQQDTNLSLDSSVLDCIKSLTPSFLSNFSSYALREVAPLLKLPVENHPDDMSLPKVVQKMPGVNKRVDYNSRIRDIFPELVDLIGEQNLLELLKADLEDLVTRALQQPESALDQRTSSCSPYRSGAREARDYFNEYVAPIWQNQELPLEERRNEVTNLMIDEMDCENHGFGYEQALFALIVELTNGDPVIVSDICNRGFKTGNDIDFAVGALNLLLSSRNTDALKSVLEAIEAKDGKEGLQEIQRAWMLLALKQEDFDLLQYYIQDLDFNPSLQDKSGKTLLHEVRSSCSCRIAMITKLLELGCDHEIRDNDGKLFQELAGANCSPI